jgi:hypothetical protein
MRRNWLDLLLWCGKSVANTCIVGNKSGKAWQTNAWSEIGSKKNRKQNGKQGKAWQGKLDVSLEGWRSWLDLTSTGQSSVLPKQCLRSFHVRPSFPTLELGDDFGAAAKQAVDHGRIGDGSMDGTIEAMSGAPETDVCKLGLHDVHRLLQTRHFS